MLYYEFQTQQEAEQADAQIIANVALWVSENLPERYDPNGPRLLGQRASNGEIVTDSGGTTRWAIPQETLGGTWVIPVPEQSDVFPMPIELVLVNITAPTIEDPEWPVEDLGGE